MNLYLVNYMNNNKFVELLKEIVIAYETNNQTELSNKINEAGNCVNDFYVEQNNKNNFIQDITSTN